MKNKAKIIIAILVVVAVIIGGVLVVTKSDNNVDVKQNVQENVQVNVEAEYDVVEMGLYPQTKVTDNSLLGNLNALTLEWISYGYYSEKNYVNFTRIESGDWMQYADVEYNGNKYRAVKFSLYRPEMVSFEAGKEAKGTYQDDNGYVVDTVYWFKYEPIQWRVLDESNGLMLSEKILDCQAFNETDIGQFRYDYSESSIREWLNGDFCNIAFSETEKSKIVLTECENSGEDNDHSTYVGKTTEDKVFLMSDTDVVNVSYGFSADEKAYDELKQKKATDYAKIQGIKIWNREEMQNVTSEKADELSDWWTRSIYTGVDGNQLANRVDVVEYSGYVGYGYTPEISGVCPAICVKK